jgi:hypothetical protein
MGDENETPLGSMDSQTRNFLALLIVGIIMLVIGFDANSTPVVDIGLIATTVALFAGALLLKVEGYARLGMLIAAGMVLSFVLSSISSVSSYSAPF